MPYRFFISPWAPYAIGSGLILFRISWWFRATIVTPGPWVTSWDLLSLVPWVVWAVYSGLVFELARRFPLPRPVNFAVHTLAAVALQTPIELYWWTCAAPASDWPELSYALFRYGVGLLCYGVLLSAALVRDRYIAQHRQAATLLRLQRELADAELASLRLQVDPGLLAAALKQIEEACTDDKERAEALMVLLADFLRATLEQIERGDARLAGDVSRLRPMVALVAELDHRRIHFDVDIPEEQLRATPAPPALLPTVHAEIAAMKDARELTVRMSLRGSEVVLETINGSTRTLLLDIPDERAAPATGDETALPALAEMTSFLSHGSYNAKIALVFAVTYVFKLVACVDIVDMGIVPLLVWSGVSTLLAIPGVYVSIWTARRIRTNVPAAVPFLTLAVVTFAAAVVCELAFAATFPHYVARFMRQGPHFWTTFIPSRGISHNHLLFAAFAFIAVAARYDARELDFMALRARVREAQLRKLRSQLRPHFLFNSLNSVLGRLWRDADAACEMTANIRRFLATTLELEPETLVPLSEELASVREYLSIEKNRMGSRMNVIFGVGNAAMATRVPALLLQPLVENAVQHGVAAVSRPVTIQITAERRGPALVIGVTDDGPGPDRGWRDGVGLSTTRALLRTVYGDDARFEAAGNAGFAVTMTLPAL